MDRRDPSASRCIRLALLQRSPRRILINSSADLFHEKLAVETIDALHAVIAIAHWHRFLLLTKRTDRMRAYYADPQTPYRIAVAIDSLAATVLPGLGPHPRSGGAGTVVAPRATRTRSAGAWQLWAIGLSRVIRQPADPQSGKPSPVGLDPWPLPNLWLGVSVEDQERIGPGARPSDPDWVRGLRDGCVAAGLPFLFKQWGEWAPAPDDGFGHRMVRLGRRAAGRLVDGRFWDELPSALHRGAGRQR
jgi:protein gp37